ncbi:MAG: HD domain-containing protein [Dehalococcoidia bacterium]
MHDHPDSALQIVVVAALLHDIGVLAQRSMDSSGPTTGHAALAAAFVAERAPAPFREASSLILAHHRPDDRLSRILEAADRIAAAGPDDEDAGRPILQRRSAIPAISHDPTTPARTTSFFEVGSLPSSLEANAPRTSPMERDEVRRRLISLAEMIATEHIAAASPDFTCYVRGLLDLIDRVACFAPAPSREPSNDISLATHLRLTAALAACLLRDDTDDATLGALVAEDGGSLDAPVAVLVSGVLKRHPTRPDSTLSLPMLQARALLDGELTSAVEDWLLRSLDLPPVCRIAGSSEGFLLLVPLAAQDRLPSIALDLERRLLDGGGETAARLAWEPISGRGIANRAGTLVANLARQRSAPRPFGSTSAADLSRLFAARDPDDDDRAAELGQLADQLRQASHLLVADVEEPLGPVRIVERPLAAFGRSIVVVAGATPPDLPAGARRARLERFGQSGPHEASWRAWAQRQSAPVALVSRPPFSPANDDSSGLLVLDLDSSRDLLAEGLANAPLARVIDLLGLLQHFLRTVAPIAAAEQSGVPVALVATGADDLTVAAPPEALPRIGFAVAQSLAAITGEHPALRLSAAVAPIGRPAQAIAAAEWLLRQSAKRYRRVSGREKDAIALFGGTVGWDEFPAVWERYTRLNDLIGKRRVSPRLLAILQAVDRGGVWRATYDLRQMSQGGRLPEADAATFAAELARPDSAARLALAARWAETAVQSRNAEARHE